MSKPRYLRPALAACSFALPALGDSNLIDIQLTPAGHFVPSDGREMKVPSWYIDAASATRVIERFNVRKTPPVVDYEHQTLRAETNGQPAPAAAWMRALQWREGSGLWATVELTARAAELIRSGEYAYVSPVFVFDERTGEVQAILMAALTNNPAIDGMAAVAARAAATFDLHTDSYEEDPMNPLLKALLAALGLPETTTEDEAIAACSALKDARGALSAVAQAVGAKNGDDLIAVCSALKLNATTPDPAKFVPVAVAKDLQDRLAVLTAERTTEKVTALVDAGLADGRLLESQKDWATKLGTSDIAALSQYLDTAQPIAALSGTQTGGRRPTNDKAAHGLTEGELAVCSMTGINPKDFAAAKPQA